jgi:hypothetical protein
VQKNVPPWSLARRLDFADDEQNLVIPVLRAKAGVCVMIKLLALTDAKSRRAEDDRGTLHVVRTCIYIFPSFFFSSFSPSKVADEDEILS